MLAADSGMSLPLVFHSGVNSILVCQINMVLIFIAMNITVC